VGTYHSFREGSTAGSSTTGSNFSASPSPLGIMSPYPPSFLLYTILTSPEANEKHFPRISKDKLLIVREEGQGNDGRSKSNKR